MDMPVIDVVEVVGLGVLCLGLVEGEVRLIHLLGQFSDEFVHVLSFKRVSENTATCLMI